MKVILNEDELKEAIIIWGIENGFRFPDDITVKIRRKNTNDEVASILIDVPESDSGTASGYSAEDGGHDVNGIY